MKDTNFSVYFAGELFSVKHLIGNAVLANSINELSGGRYSCVVPQDLEQRSLDPVSIRNQDLLHVVSCDLGVFNFDGTELDSGTLVEFMMAKMMDIPSVIVRSDFRKGGDSKDHQWNLMVTGFPRTQVVCVDSMELYKNFIHSGMNSIEASFEATGVISAKVINALDEVRSEAPVIPPFLRCVAYELARVFPGGKFDDVFTRDAAIDTLNSKVKKKLL